MTTGYASTGSSRSDRPARRAGACRPRMARAGLRGGGHLQRPPVEPERAGVSGHVHRHGRSTPARIARSPSSRGARAHRRRRELGLRPRGRRRGRGTRVDDLDAPRADVPAEVGLRPPAGRAHLADTAAGPGQRAHLPGDVRHRDRACARVPRARGAPVAEPQRPAPGRQQPASLLDPARADPRRAGDRAVRRPARPLRRRHERGVRHDPLGDGLQAHVAVPRRRRRSAGKTVRRCERPGSRCRSAPRTSTSSGSPGRGDRSFPSTPSRPSWSCACDGSIPARAPRWRRASPSSRHPTRASTSCARSGRGR